MTTTNHAVKSGGPDYTLAKRMVSGIGVRGTVSSQPGMVSVDFRLRPVASAPCEGHKDIPPIYLTTPPDSDTRTRVANMHENGFLLRSGMGLDVDSRTRARGFQELK